MTADGGSVLAGKLVKIIETRAADIAMTWYNDVKVSHYTPSFADYPIEDALQIAMDVYNKLGYWLLPSTESEVRDTYKRYGASMFFKGFRMDEMVMALILLKRHLWLHLLEEGLMTTNLEMYQALDLNNRVVLYFDRAIYFALIGYMDARAKDRKTRASY